MSEKVFIHHCSPTLAGIKTANLFSCRFADEKEMRSSIRRLNGMLVKKGIRVLPLQYHKGYTLIYTYRPSELLRDLQQTAASRLLKERGYTSGIPEQCIVQLMQRLADKGEFPHEIGLFLGYPPEDVYGFIKNKAKGYKCVGEWKVYGDAEKAREIFEKYRKCTEVYCAQFAQGKSIEQLTVVKNFTEEE